MADKQSAERARLISEAREYLREHSPGCEGMANVFDMADFAALAVEREREDCAKLTCEQCRNNAWSDPVPDAGHKGRYIHVKLFNGQKAYCSASAIWARDVERG